MSAERDDITRYTSLQQPWLLRLDAILQGEQRPPYAFLTTQGLAVRLPTPTPVKRNGCLARFGSRITIAFFALSTSLLLLRVAMEVQRTAQLEASIEELNRNLTYHRQFANEQVCVALPQL